jgi:hypothetical protein
MALLLIASSISILLFFKLQAIYQSHTVEFAVYTHCSISKEVRSIGTSPALMNVRGFPVVEETDLVCEGTSKLNKSFSTLSLEYSVSNNQIIKSNKTASNYSNVSRYGSQI